MSEPMQETRLGSPNASKHLQLLRGLAFVERRKARLFVYYRLADDSVFRLCDLVCGRLVEESQKRSELVATR